ncbi:MULTISPECIES: ABC transporter substrate-binding protein [Tsukamurella]|uniref:Ferric enterobactin (Enterochelin)-binding protein n=2 Tax=Tsukamurella TaxID=2060 RepID=A0A138AIB0_9ACTN|nr:MULTISPECIES: ABC transporter substrate-binding protein [Tsukamurella]KXO98571.1 ferric enterobactin (enterochelin)-binding protein [Tsukamurella pseudospumae]KXP10115.1 ferric enterobactin (enterochelin)-binding protein [Tsukamurella pseudospumae]NKY18488.1 ABC transporter substrate-binding protein [Tsukamurella spumae]
MKRQFRIIAALACAVALVAGCGDSGAKDAPADTATRTISTVKGEVTVPVAPKRVVLLNYSLAGYAFDLGLPIVAMTPEATDKTSVPRDAWKADFDKAGTKFLPWPSTGFDIEAITAQKPDLILAGGLAFPFKQASDSYDKLSKIAPTVLVDNKLDTWQQQFKWIADSFGKPDVYTDAAKRYDARIEQVKGNITVPPNPVSFLSMTADKRPFVLIENRGLPAEFARLGFTTDPLFASGKYKPYQAGGDSFELSSELLPSVITQPTVFIIGFNRDTFDVAKLRSEPVYAALPAFTTNHAYDLPYWVQRPDFDRAMDTLDVVEKTFRKK